MRVLLRLFLIEMEHQEYLFMQFMCMSVYPKNHKCEVENELWMVPLKQGASSSWSSSLCSPMRKSEEMTIGKTHPSLYLKTFQKDISVEKFLDEANKTFKSRCYNNFVRVNQPLFDKRSQDFRCSNDFQPFIRSCYRIIRS